MILQIGAFFGDLFGIESGKGLFSSLGGFLKETVTGAVRGSGLLDIGKDLLKREVGRIVNRKAKAQEKHTLRQQSNLAGQGPAVIGQGPVATGGRVFQPPQLVGNIIPPGIGTQVPVSAVQRQGQRAARRAGVRPVGMFQDFRQDLRNFGLPTGSRFLRQEGLPGTRFGSRDVGLNGGILPPPPAPFRSFGGGRFPSGPTGLTGAPSVPGLSTFQRNVFGGVQHYVLDTNGCLEPIESARELNGLPKFRLDLADGKFKKIKSRRMNPLNFKALGRARRRTGAALRVCRTMFTEARREKTGRVRPKRRAKRK